MVVGPNCGSDSPTVDLLFHTNQLHNDMQRNIMENMYTATQAAREIGCSQSTVSRWAKDLGFQTKYGSCLVLTKDQVEKIASVWRQKTGNPNFVQKTS